MIRIRIHGFLKQYRNDIRAFLKGDPDAVSSLAHRLLASPDLYEHKEREPEQSINFVTCHDGFTLNDLVSYNHKHNDTNGEDNRDGSDHNLRVSGASYSGGHLDERN